MTISICVLALTLLTSFQGEVLAQVLPPYGAAPIPYINNEDDDLGILMAILLLAGRNKGGGCNCCNCCHCGKSAQTVPIPYPIPFPINNPIINKGPRNSDYEESEDKPKMNSDAFEETALILGPTGSYE